MCGFFFSGRRRPTLGALVSGGQTCALPICSTGNVLAAICSFFIPGLGQLVQGRLLIAVVMFVLAAVLWIVLLGWLIHLWSILDAALFKPRRSAERRVGNACARTCRSRWSPTHHTNKNKIQIY